MIVLGNGDVIEGDATNASEVDFTIHGLDNNVLALLANGQLASSKGTIYTADSVDVITSIILVNTGAAHNHVNLYLKKSGGTSRRLIEKDYQMEVNKSITFDGKNVGTGGGGTTVTDETISMTDVTTNDASTTKHGFALKATAPAAGLTNVIAIENGETVYKNKALYDATVPSTQALGDAAAAGSAIVAARRDHKHAMPASTDLFDDTAGGTDALTTKAPTSNAFYDVAHALPNRNAIINGGMGVSQRGTTFNSATTPPNSDDTYLLDRWILLSNGNDIVDVSRVARAVPNGSTHEIKLEVETANKQFGICTILENKDSARFIGKTCSLSFKARMAAADDNTHSVVAVILSWHSTADSVTSDVVGTWAAPITGWTAEWAVEGETASQALTTTEQTIKLENVVIDNDTTNTKNIAVFIYCDQTNGAVDDAIIITDVQLELGSVATPFEFRHYGQELALCQRYYETSNDQGDIPGTIDEYAMSKVSTFGGACNAANDYCYLSIPYKVTKREEPTLRVWDKAGTVGKICVINADSSLTNGVEGNPRTSESHLVINAVAGATTARGICAQWDADIEL